MPVITLNRQDASANGDRSYPEGPAHSTVPPTGLTATHPLTTTAPKPFDPLYDAQHPLRSSQFLTFIHTLPSDLMPPTRRSARPATVTAPYARADRASSDSDSPTPVSKKRNVRSTRNPRTVIEPDSDDDDDLEAYDQTLETEVNVEDSEEVEDEDMEDEEEDVDGGQEEEVEEEDDEEEEDDDMDDDDVDAVMNHPPPPPPKIQIHPNSKGRPSITVKPATQSKLKSVEDKEMEGDDDELSDLDSDDEGQDIGVGDDDEDELDGEDDDEDSDGSRDGTPDLTKLTRRQRGQFEDFDGNLLALSNEAQTRKQISAEEHAMRRAEMARRRKNLSEKRNEEEKAETINKLLKKPAPKRRTRAEILAAQAAGESGTPGAEGEEADEVKPDAVYTRWVSASDGFRLGVPEEWLSAPIGNTFVQDEQASASGKARIMVEEVA